MTQPLDALIAGYNRFRDTGWRQQRERWAELKDGQTPKVMVIACSDSRVDPSQIFDTSPGEMFVVRNVAAMVPPFETGGGRHGVSAALEFAVTQLEVAEIVVMGHGACGGVNAALTRRFEEAAPGEGGFIAGWMSLLDAARDRVVHSHGEGPEVGRAMELEAVKVSIDNLRSFPFVREREQAGTLKLHGAYFAIADGVLHLLGEDGAFHPA
ncbi:carbonic anhydrase [Sphingomonas sp. ID1715]|uniref:carbonic anhydrase n=1 Tax=Sphingomonas sp. ID1715 TaxID=1656898 RepID=UPI0014895BAB|nr:carbonic anhydrase [Sphingomonas sp. ID1715]NNM75402.1 carbonic anhydrase [Sphingomonas sp. ID1715]